MLAERRRNVRHKIQRPAYVSIAEGTRGLILDSNERGLALQSDVPVPLGTRVNVKLEVVEPSRCIVTGARVVWSDPRGRVGIEFLGISPESRGDLRQWLRLNSQAQGSRAKSPSAVKPVCEDASAAETSSDALFASAAERAILLTRAHGAAIALNDGGGGLACRSAAGEIAPLVGSRIDSQSGLTGACLRSGRVMRCNSTDSDPLVNRESCRSLGISSVIAAPIVHAGCIVGLIEVFSHRSHAFDDSDCYALERLAETMAESGAVRAASGQRSGKTSSKTVKTPEIALHAAEAEQAWSATPVDAAQPSLSREALAMVASDESSQLDVLRLAAGYEFLLTEKLTLHKRILLWSVVAIVVVFGLWLSFGNPWRWRSNRPPTPNLQSLGRTQTSLTASAPRSAPALVSITRDALEEVHQRAESGDANAQLRLGAAYASGKDLGQNYTEAVKWLKRSAEQGNATAATSLGAFYWAGRGVSQEYVDAYMWSAIAEAEGDEASSYRVTILQSRMSPAELAESRRRTTAWLQTHSKHNALKRNAPTDR
jgi:TPR repeat protein